MLVKRVRNIDVDNLFDFNKYYNNEKKSTCSTFSILKSSITYYYASLEITNTILDVASTILENSTFLFLQSSTSLLDKFDNYFDLLSIISLYIDSLFLTLALDFIERTLVVRLLDLLNFDSNFILFNYELSQLSNSIDSFESHFLLENVITTSTLLYFVDKSINESINESISNETISIEIAFLLFGENNYMETLLSITSTLDFGATNQSITIENISEHQVSNAKETKEKEKRKKIEKEDTTYKREKKKKIEEENKIERISARVNSINDKNRI